MPTENKLQLFYPGICDPPTECMGVDLYPSTARRTTVYLFFFGPQNRDHVPGVFYMAIRVPVCLIVGRPAPELPGIEQTDGSDLGQCVVRLFFYDLRDIIQDILCNLA